MDYGQQDSNLCNCGQCVTAATATSLEQDPSMIALMSLLGIPSSSNRQAMFEQSTLNPVDRLPLLNMPMEQSFAHYPPAETVKKQPVLNTKPKTSIKDVSVDRQQFEVTNENAVEMFDMARANGFVGNLETFLSQLDSGVPIVLATDQSRNVGTGTPREIAPEIHTAANPETMAKFVNTEMVPAFFKAIQELPAQHTGDDLLRQQRKLSARLQKLLTLVACPERIVPTCINDKYEMAIYKHYVAGQVVNFIIGESRGSQLIGAALKGLKERDAAKDAAKAAAVKEVEVQAVRSSIELQLIGNEGLSHDGLVAKLRELAGNLEASYKQPDATPLPKEEAVQEEAVPAVVNQYFNDGQRVGVTETGPRHMHVGVIQEGILSRERAKALAQFMGVTPEMITGIATPPTIEAFFQEILERLESRKRG